MKNIINLYSAEYAQRVLMSCMWKIDALSGEATLSKFSFASLLRSLFFLYVSQVMYLENFLFFYPMEKLCCDSLFQEWSQSSDSGNTPQHKIRFIMKHIMFALFNYFFSFWAKLEEPQKKKYIISSEKRNNIVLFFVVIVWWISSKITTQTRIYIPYLY